MSSSERAHATPSVLDRGLPREGLGTAYDRGLAAASQSGRRRRERSRGVRRYLLVADLAALAVAFASLQLVFPAQAMDDRLALNGELLLFAASLPLWVALARAIGLYDRDAERPEHTTVDDLVGIVALVTMVVWLSFVVSYVTGIASPDFGKWVIFWVFAIVAIALARSAARMIVGHRASLVQRALIVGTDRDAQLVGRKLAQHPEYRISLVGFVDASPSRLRDEVFHVPVVGGVEEVPTLIERLGIDRVVFGFSGATQRQMLRLVRHLQALGVQAGHRPAHGRGARAERERHVDRGDAARELAADEDRS